MSRLRIHLEPVGAMRTQLEVGQLQRARHRSRPLLTGCGSYRHGLAKAEAGPAGLRLRCRDAEDARRAAVLARRALATLAPLHGLLDGQVCDRVSVEGSEVAIESGFPPYLVHRVLDSVKALPQDRDASAPGTVEFVEYTGPDAIAAFQRGDLQATAPTSFEIARDCSSDARFHSYQLEIFALLLIGPRQPDRRSIVQGRRILRDGLAAEPALTGSLDVAEADDAPKPAGRAVGRESDLLYADFWPNAAIVRSLGAGLDLLGCTARPRPVPLGELHSRTSTGAFDLALVLANGYAGPQLSIPLTLARSAALTYPAALPRSASVLAPLRKALAEALSGGEDGPAWQVVTAAALQWVPAVPLARLRGGSLLDPALPDHPPAYGCVLPLEHYAGGCDA
ncbi:MAG: hypothetical protein ABIQ09_16645 [Jatrophihabitantaceae bacterium]